MRQETNFAKQPDSSVFAFFRIDIVSIISENEFAKGKSHDNGIEVFWAFAKRRLAKFMGIQAKL